MLLCVCECVWGGGGKCVCLSERVNACVCGRFCLCANEKREREEETGEMLLRVG